MIELPQAPSIGRMTGVAILPQRAFMVIVLFMTAHAIGVGAGKLVADMAALARHRTVQPHQGEIGEVVIEAIDGFPAVGDVAGGAHLHLGILVDVVRRMAGGAIARQGILQGADVAIGAGELLVVPGERKSCLAGVIKFRLFPANGGVAGFTFLTVTPQMDVAVGVAAMAGRREIFFNDPVGMTGAARQLRMVMEQRKIRFIVIEDPLVPAVHRMAGVTLFAVFAGVDISRLVTAHTGGLFKLIALPCMAAAAGYLAVAAAQIKTGRGVIKLLTFLPALRGVTGAALRAERAFVEVVLFVTAGALRLRIAKFFAVFMATVTGQGGVLAFKRKTRPLMTESINRDRNDVGVATEVVGVTGITVFDAGQGRLAVEAGFAVAVVADVVVAVQA